MAHVSGISIVRRARTLAASLALPALLPGLAYADTPPPPSVPAAIQVPDGNVPFLLGHATGTQNYTCQPSSTAGYAWTFTGPSATLVDDDGKQIITHFAVPAGPAGRRSTAAASWARGSTGVTVSPSAIPWLLLSAKSTTPPSGPAASG